MTRPTAGFPKMDLVPKHAKNDAKKSLSVGKGNTAIAPMDRVKKSPGPNGSKTRQVHRTPKG